jgi:uncharacterized protein (TIGR03083 family)
VSPAPDERRAFTSASAWFLDVVPSADGHWDAPGLGEWSVRDLVGHTSRSLVTVEAYLDVDPGEVTVPSAVGYYEALRGASSAAVTERGRAAGRAMGDDPVAFLHALEARVRDRVARAADDAYVGTVAGGMRLVDYLPTRTFELVVHTVDLAHALDLPVDPPAEALASALRLACGLAAGSGSGADVLLALTGRRPLPASFTLL